MKTPEEIAAELAADVWEPFNEGSQHDVDVLNRIESFVSASIRKARRDGAEAMRKECVRLFGDYWNFEFGSELTHEHTLDDLECCIDAMANLPLPGDEPKEPDHAK